MPGLVKIGYSVDPVQRIDELSAGMPESFKLEATWTADNAHFIERKIHRYLDIYRYNQKKEFFELGVTAATHLIQAIVDEQHQPLASISKIISLDTFGASISAARKAQGMTQADLASAANCTRKLVLQLENGNANPTFDTIIRILEVLGLTMHLS